jgi:essential nuclear protein 1
LPSKLSKRIVEQAREQQLDDEDIDDSGAADRADAGKKRKVRFGAAKTTKSTTSTKPSIFSKAEDDEDDEDDEVIDFGVEDDIALDGEYIDIRDTRGGAGQAEDAAVLRRFMPEDSSARRTLADIIMDKLREKEEYNAAMAAGGAEGGDDDEEGGWTGPPPLDPRVVEVYTEVGKYLTHFRSGKVPKVFKAIPALSNWEEVLFLTNPETWSAHALYAATRIFASNFNAAKAQRFFNLILLPKCRDDIFAHKRLNFHLYLALKKATYKPAGFYRGIVLPLALSGDCTLREAVIIASVISKNSIPQLHSAAAMMKLCTMPYSGAVSVFLKALVNKKYSLPFVAVDTLVDHFRQFSGSGEPSMPIIWHQCLLSVAQRYKADLTREQKSFLHKLAGEHTHYLISSEIRRELASAPCRGDPVSVPAAPIVNNTAKISSGGQQAPKGKKFIQSEMEY